MMKRSRCAEGQIMVILREQESGVETTDVCRKYRISGTRALRSLTHGQGGVGQATKLQI